MDTDSLVCWSTLGCLSTVVVELPQGIGQQDAVISLLEAPFFRLVSLFLEVAKHTGGQNPIEIHTTGERGYRLRRDVLLLCHVLKLHEVVEVIMHLADLSVNGRVDVVPHIAVVTTRKRTLIAPEHAVPTYQYDSTRCKGDLTHLVVAIHKGKDPVDTWCLGAADVQLAQHDLVFERR